MDQYRSASVTVSHFRSSIEIYSFNGTRVVANTEYVITVTALGVTTSSYPSDPVVVSKFLCI